MGGKENDLPLFLASDFGSSSVYTGQMRAAALRAVPGVAVHDLWHGIPSHRVDLAAFFLPRLWAHCPARAVQVAVVDPGVGTARHPLVLAWQDMFLVGPDNGIFTQPLQDGAQARLVVTDEGGLSATFHGRDLFAPFAARLACGRIRFSDLPELFDQSPMTIDLPGSERMTDDRVKGRVVHADRFGNLITSISGEGLPATGWQVRTGSRIIAGARTYGEVSRGELLALIGSFGLVEIARHEGSAAELLGLGDGGEVVLEVATK